MKKIAYFVFSFLALSTMPVFAASKEISASGEVISADPLYKRVTIKHEAIKDFSEAGENEYTVASASLLDGLSRYDLVDFKLKTEGMGDAEITSITKTGQAEHEEEGLPIGPAVQGALESTAGAAKSLTEPIAPAHEIVSAATDATTNTTGTVLDDSRNLESKKKF